MKKLATLAVAVVPLVAGADEARQQFPGFSLVPPTGDAWQLEGRSPTSVLWLRDTGSPETKFAFAVLAGPAPTSVRSQPELVAFLEAMGSAPPPSPDLELVSSTAEAVDGPGGTCARHESRVRDAAAGTRLDVVGITCLHPEYPGRMYDVQFSQRTTAGQPDEALRLEGEALLESFRFEEAPYDDDWDLD
ncbi:MAG: hypothetical protein P8102_04345 [Gammaproteobacteria bacterium]